MYEAMKDSREGQGAALLSGALGLSWAGEPMRCHLVSLVDCQYLESKSHCIYLCIPSHCTSRELST